MSETEKARRALLAAQIRARIEQRKEPQQEKAAKPSTEKAGKKRSKKHDMAKLPADWRERVFAKASSTGERGRRIVDAISVLWATGCRPAELEKGVKIKLVGKQLVITIEGSKVGKIDNGDTVADRGISKRQITLDVDLNDATRHLAKVALTQQSVQYHRETLRSVMNKLTHKMNIFGKAKNPPTLSPYSFRHAMASDLKSCDTLTDEDRAKVLGHLAVDSIQSYGRRRRGGGGISPIKSVQTSREPVGGISHGFSQKSKKFDLKI